MPEPDCAKVRKAFAISLGATFSALLIAAELAVPGWFGDWLTTLRAYSHYAGSRPLLEEILRGYFFLPSAVLLIGAVVWVSFKFRDSDLLFAISFSAAVFQLLFPFQLYNTVLNEYLVACLSYVFSALSKFSFHDESDKLFYTH